MFIIGVRIIRADKNGYFEIILCFYLGESCIIGQHKGTDETEH